MQKQCIGDALMLLAKGKSERLSEDCCLKLKHVDEECIPKFLDFMNPFKLIKKTCSKHESFRK